jgi:CubicO group peptidase (beta-lactamase class C family)
MLFASGHVEHKEVDPETTIFSAASISKLIIGTAVMQCVEDDLMQLDGPVSSYLPGDCAVYNPFYDGHVITIEMLLRHTSSLQDNEEQLCQGSRYRVDGGGAMPMSMDEYVKQFVSNNPAIWSDSNSPGTAESYSNAGFTILGLAVQTVRKKPLKEVIENRIFGPLGMTHSSFFLHDALATQGCAVAQPTPPGRYYEVAEWPAAQLRSTAPDILRFLRCFTRRGPPSSCPNVVTAASRERMQPPAGDRGLAWWGSAFRYSCRAGAWEHGGFMQGVRSHAFVWPAGALVLLFSAEDRYETWAAALVRRLVAADSQPAAPAPGDAGPPAVGGPGRPGSDAGGGHKE